MSSIVNKHGTLPNHVAIIMDGNRRWAKQHSKIGISGHQAGVEAVKKTVKYALLKGIRVLTLYAFSSENWKRPPTEVTALITLFTYVIEKEVDKLYERNICLKIIGDKSRFGAKLHKMIDHAEMCTANNDGLTLIIAANYGGQWDIVQAMQDIAAKVKEGNLSIHEINESLINKHVCLSDYPPVDLLIRTGGEHRISNFLLWQIAYAEFFFTDVLWPDFDEQTFDLVLQDFALRERRFGAA